MGLFDFVETGFNVDNGFLEGLIRGFKNGILKEEDYRHLTQCETLDDLKLHLQSTSYGNFLSNEPSPLAVTTIDSKMREKLVDEFRYVRNHAYKELATFLDFVTYSYMIDNLILLITGSLRQRQISDLLPKCHPIGHFEDMEVAKISNNTAELYNSVLIDTPLARFFKDCISFEDFNELNIEVIRNTLYKSYLEQFYDFCEACGGATAEVMCEILAFECDRRSFIITINSFGTELSKDDRVKLYPRRGKLYPDGLKELENANDYESVKRVADYYPEYKKLFDGVGSGVGEKTLEEKFYEYEVYLNKYSFMQQFQYGTFYSLIKLREQESRNIIWISECISQQHRSKIDNFLTIF